MLREGIDYQIIRDVQDVIVFEHFGGSVRKLYGEKAHITNGCNVRFVYLNEVNQDSVNYGNSMLQMGEGFICEYTAERETMLAFNASFTTRVSAAAKIFVIDDVSEYGGIKGCHGAMLCMEPGVKMKQWNLPPNVARKGQIDFGMQEFYGKGTLIMELPGMTPIFKLEVTKDNPCIFACGKFGAMSQHLKVGIRPYANSTMTNMLGYQVVVYTEDKPGYVWVCGGSPLKNNF